MGGFLIMLQASLMDMGFKISKSVSIKRDVGVGARIILKWILKMHKDAYSIQLAQDTLQ
jgi:hypothetical protein